jgi:hypothetical protein
VNEFAASVKIRDPKAIVIITYVVTTHVALLITL